MSAKTTVAPPALTEETKPFWASQTIWSALAVVGASVAGAWLAWRSGDLEAFAAALTAALGGLNAIVGRIRATTVIR
jgi:hypothetical protein